MPALFEDMIKCTQNDLELSDSSEKINKHLMDKMFLYYKLISASFKTYYLWCTGKLISSYSLNNSKLK